MNNIKLILVVCAVGLLFSCGKDQTDKPAFADHDKSVMVKVIKPKIEKFQEYGEYYGITSGIETARILAAAGGNVESILAIEGQTVSAGDSLARIDSDKADVLYQTAVLSEKMTKDGYKREKSNHEKGFSSAMAIDQAHLAWLQAKAALLSAREAWEGAHCISPIDGTIVSIYIDKHQTLPPGSAAFEVANLKKIRIIFGIPEMDLKGVSEGNEALVYFDSDPEKVHTGKLISYSRKVSSDSLSYEAEVIIDNPDLEIHPGVMAKVKLLRNAYTDKIVLPLDLVQNNGTASYVMLAEDGKAVMREVETGPSTNTHTVILSGLSEKDRVISEGVHIVNAGTEIEVVRQES